MSSTQTWTTPAAQCRPPGEPGRQDEIDCATLLERVAAYLEVHDASDSLPETLQRVRQHLTVCPECREEFDALVRACAK